MIFLLLIFFPFVSYVSCKISELSCFDTSSFLSLFSSLHPRVEAGMRILKRKASEMRVLVAVLKQDALSPSLSSASCLSLSFSPLFFVF